MEARLVTGAAGRKDGELLEHVRGAAVRAARLRIVYADELLEVRLALHAGVFVDRHEDQFTQEAYPFCLRNPRSFRRYARPAG
jgi:hypothetical protein